MHASQPPATGERLGLGQWFHYEAYDELAASVALLRDLRCRRLRTGISWADFHRPNGRAWYDHQFESLREFEQLVSIWHVPPSIAEGGTTNSPPIRLEEYAEFVSYMIHLYGDSIGAVELWNEPNNWLKWNFFDYDPHWSKFATMIRAAAQAAHERGVTTVLGGMIPVDPHWLALMQDAGALEHIDVVAIHGFPGMWWDEAPNWDWHAHWLGWEEKVEKIRTMCDRPIWITETGLATWELERCCRGRYELQSQMLDDAYRAPAERVYWYSLMDLAPDRSAIEGFHADENEYHLGLVTHDGQRKPAYDRMKKLLAHERRSVVKVGEQP